MTGAQRRTRITWLAANDPPEAFPAVEQALENPNGLLAAGADLSQARLLLAYQMGIFPWYEEGQPILWWSPDPRAVLRPEQLKLSARLRRTLRQGKFTVRSDSAFDRVIDACAGPRRYGSGTWITADMKAAYRGLHSAGWCHSVEVWQDDRLAGGIYGLAIGRVFFGESMFSAVRDASKVALAHLCAFLIAEGYVLLDCQDWSAHLQSLGASLMPRSEFVALLQRHCQPEGVPGSWKTSFETFLEQAESLPWAL
jgi:leucyl/phenylalanyl-tRNA--protein transferase